MRSVNSVDLLTGRTVSLWKHVAVEMWTAKFALW